MPRPWEYTRARRIAMQVVMCLLLGATITVAYGVQRYRSALLIPRQWQSVKAGGFTFDLPEGWHVDTRQHFAGFVEVEGSEKHATLGVRRAVQFFARNIHGNESTSVDDFASTDSDYDFSPDDARPVDFLGQHGIWVDVPPEVESAGVRAGFLRAYVILPTKKGVMVTLVGPTAFAPADVALFRHVLESMRYVPEAKHEFRGVPT